MTLLEDKKDTNQTCSLAAASDEASEYIRIPFWLSLCNTIAYGPVTSWLVTNVIHTYTHACVHTYTDINAYMYSTIYKHTHTNTHTSHIHMYIDMCVCVCVCMETYTQTYIHHYAFKDDELINLIDEWRRRAEITSRWAIWRRFMHHQQSEAFQQKFLFACVSK